MGEWLSERVRGPFGVWDLVNRSKQFVCVSVVLITKKSTGNLLCGGGRIETPLFAPGSERRSPACGENAQRDRRCRHPQRSHGD